MQETAVPATPVDFWTALAAFVGFLAVLVAIGAYTARFSSAGIGNYFVAGRKMSRLVTALSAVVSGRSVWVLLGVTGIAYMEGASALWAIVGYTVVEFFLFLYYAPRLRRMAGAHDCVTLPDFFAARLGDGDRRVEGLLRAALALVLLLFMTAYVSSQFVGGGKAVGVSFGIGEEWGILITAVVVLLYTVVGGFLAVSLTDTLQAFFMFFALVLLPVVLISAGGGWGPVMGELAAYEPGFADPLALGLGAFLAHVGIGLGSPGNPHILVRYLAISDAAQFRWAAYVGTFWNVVMGVGAVLVGIAGRAFVPEVGMLPNADEETLLPVLAEMHLPAILFGMIVASIFAAIMSSADSQLLVAASSVVRDVYQKVLRRDEEVPQRFLVLLSRVIVTILVVAALIMGFLAEELVFWLVLFAWAGLGAALGPTMILALYWRRTTAAGVVAGIAVGTGATFLWNLHPSLDLYELIPAFFLGLAATVVVSLLTRAPSSTERDFRIMAGDE